MGSLSLMVSIVAALPFRLLQFAFGTVKQGKMHQIQVEHLTASVVEFIVTVELIALQGKMTDVARRE